MQPFLEVTKRMEGDQPTGCMVIAEYVELKKTLHARSERLDTTDAMYPMLAAMLEKTQQILEEALKCEPLVMACLLHPAFRLRFFHAFFGKTSSVSFRAEALFNSEFKMYQAGFAMKDKPSNTRGDSHSESTEDVQPSIFAVYSDMQEEEMGDDDQLRDYLGGRDRMKAPEYDLRDPNSALQWWKVRNPCALLSFTKADV